MDEVASIEVSYGDGPDEYGVTKPVSEGENEQIAIAIGHGDDDDLAPHVRMEEMGDIEVVDEKWRLSFGMEEMFIDRSVGLEARPVSAADRRGEAQVVDLDWPGSARVSAHLEWGKSDDVDEFEQGGPSLSADVDFRESDELTAWSGTAELSGVRDAIFARFALKLEFKDSELGAIELGESDVAEARRQWPALFAVKEEGPEKRMPNLEVDGDWSWSVDAVEAVETDPEGYSYWRAVNEIYVVDDEGGQGDPLEPTGKIFDMALMPGGEVVTLSREGNSTGNPAIFTLFDDGDVQEFEVPHADLVDDTGQCLPDRLVTVSDQRVLYFCEVTLGDGAGYYVADIDVGNEEWMSGAAPFLDLYEAWVDGMRVDAVVQTDDDIRVMSWPLGDDLSNVADVMISDVVLITPQNIELEDAALVAEDKMIYAQRSGGQLVVKEVVPAGNVTPAAKFTIDVDDSEELTGLAMDPEGLVYVAYGDQIEIYGEVQGGASDGSIGNDPAWEVVYDSTLSGVVGDMAVMPGLFGVFGDEWPQ